MSMMSYERQCYVSLAIRKFTKATKHTYCYKHYLKPKTMQYSLKLFSAE